MEPPASIGAFRVLFGQPTKEKRRPRAGACTAIDRIYIRLAGGMIPFIRK